MSGHTALIASSQPARCASPAPVSSERASYSRQARLAASQPSHSFRELVVVHDQVLEQSLWQERLERNQEALHGYGHRIAERWLCAGERREHGLHDGRQGRELALVLLHARNRRATPIVMRR